MWLSALGQWFFDARYRKRAIRFPNSMDGLRCDEFKCEVFSKGWPVLNRSRSRYNLKFENPSWFFIAAGLEKVVQLWTEAHYIPVHCFVYVGRLQVSSIVCLLSTNVPAWWFWKICGKVFGPYKDRPRRLSSTLSSPSFRTSGSPSIIKYSLLAFDERTCFMILEQVAGKSLVLVQTSRGAYLHYQSWIFWGLC